METLQLSREVAVRRLQDVAGKYRQLPRRVRLPAITERRYAGSGGEASIWLAKLSEIQVVSRECPPPEYHDWEGKDGQRILKVCPHNQIFGTPGSKTIAVLRLSVAK